jgi:hypothetical protein
MSLPPIELIKLQESPELLEKAIYRRRETEDERKSRLRQQEWTTKVKLGKDVIISLAALAAGGIVVYICLNVILNPNASPDDKKWATSLVASVASGLVGYLTGKASQ